MAKFIVQALARPGFTGYGRGGHRWPSGQTTEVEVLDQPEDPPAEPGKGIRLGQKTFAILQADGMLRISPAGDPQAIARLLDDVPQLQAEVARLQALNSQLVRELAEARASHEEQPRQTRAKRAE